jgi:uncharacterized protein (UPF0332 family)
LINPGAEFNATTGFIQNFIKTGIIETEYGKIYDYIRKKREESDYSVRITIDKETAEKVVDDAEKFIVHLAEYLRIQFGPNN